MERLYLCQSSEINILKGKWLACQGFGLLGYGLSKVTSIQRGWWLHNHHALRITFKEAIHRYPKTLAYWPVPSNYTSLIGNQLTLPEGQEDDRFDGEEFKNRIIRLKQLFCCKIEEEQSIQRQWYRYVVDNCDVQISTFWPEIEEIYGIYLDW